MNYSFSKQIKEPNQRQAVELCIAYAAKKGLILQDVSNDRSWYDRGVDLILYQENKQALIDVKCDEQISKTGNIAFELIEICGSNAYLKKGWAYSKIDYIFYVDWNNKINYLLPLGNLFEKAFSKPHKGFSAYHPVENYFTLGVLLPLNELTFNKWNL